MMNQSDAFLKMRDNDVEKPYGCMFRHSKSLQKHTHKQTCFECCSPDAFSILHHKVRDAAEE